MKNLWSQEQIIGLLREADAGQSSITELCRLRGISQNTFYDVAQAIWQHDRR